MMKETRFLSFLQKEQKGMLKLDSITDYFESKTLKKGDHILEAGRICRQIAFIEKGLVVYYNLNEGKEIICDFAKEEDWITQYESFINQSPSPLSIRAIEPSVLQVISFEKLRQLYAEIPAFELLTRKIIEGYFISSMKRNNNLQALKAEERYSRFAKENPDLIQRVPQYYIASYLGIAPQSLSRIRKNI